MAQPSLTRAIKQLEDEFGGELFRRERNLTHLTDLGHRMLPMMQQCYESAMTAKSLAQSIKSGAVAPLSVALSLALDITIVIPFMTELVRALPGLQLRFVRGPGTELADLLKKGEVEVAVGGPLGETWDRLETWSLFTEPYKVVVGAQHPFAEKSAITSAEVTKERLLSRVHCEHRSDILAFLSGCGMRDGTAHQLNSESDVMALLETNIGISIMPQSSAKSAGVKLIDLEGFDINRTVCVYAVAGRQRSMAASTLIKMLRAADWSKHQTTPVPKTAGTSANASA